MAVAVAESFDVLKLNSLFCDDSDDESFESAESDFSQERALFIAQVEKEELLSSIELLEWLPIESEEEYLEKSKACFDIVWTLYTNFDGWDTCSPTDACALVESKTLPKLGKIFKLSGVLDIDPTGLFEELYYHLPDSPKWNPTVLECKIIQIVDDCTDVFYSVAAEAGGGVIAARDFVNLRQWVVRDGAHIITGVACHHPDMPEQKEYVRAENRPGAVIIEDIPDSPNQAKFIWILNTDIKGWIPKALVDTSLCGVMLDFYKHLKLRTEEIVKGRGNDVIDDV